MTSLIKAMTVQSEATAEMTTGLRSQESSGTLVLVRT